MYRIIYLKSTTTKFGRNDLMLDTILHSPFQPGLWIKTVILDTTDFTVNNDSIRTLREIFQKFISRCPHVTWVCLHAHHFRVWSCFTKVLLLNNTWGKLEHFEAPYSSNRLEYGCYLKCAFHLRETLSSFYLARRAIQNNRKNILGLQGFNSLETLVIDQEVVDDKRDRKIISGTLSPNFSRLDIRMTRMRDKPLFQKTNVFEDGAFSAVEELIIEGFEAYCDHVVLRLIKEFPGVRQLNLYNTDLRLREYHLSKPVMKMFLEYIHRVSFAHVEFYSSDNIASILQSYYEYHNESKLQNKMGAIDSAAYLNVKYDATNTVAIQIRNGQSNLMVRLTTDHNYTWNLHNSIIEEICIVKAGTWSSFDMQNIIANNRSLCYLTIQDTLIDIHESGLANRQSKIVYLELENVTFRPGALATVSFDLPHLEHLYLYYSSFNKQTNPQVLLFDFPNTTVDSFEFEINWTWNNSFIDFSLHISIGDYPFTRYVSCVEQELMSEISGRTFISISNSGIMVLYVYLKSAKQFVISAPRNRRLIVSFD
ncbi:uncharacterized protein EV154DRAFT_500098 [Mucor mucedo]|uniref:uncharacterized protein n=1 Tax=Mucor mucedo TaxID=29922 RepID=UPI00221E856A|nr:uncharacterized protein EV154DRAFT_500098 [Mucor mucedo]KAI7893813.1 hypothetical protein EV154DRAFT_500098 [Mucor mucedo]